jgi:hypothetical protein
MIDIDSFFTTGDCGKFFDSLESECVAGCCGLEAFSFSEENVESALGDDEMDVEKLIEAIRRQIVCAQSHPEEELNSSRMNSWWRGPDLVEFLNDILLKIEKAEQKRGDWTVKEPADD